MNLSVQQFTIDFGKKVLFSQVSFQVNNGEKVALIGKNGSGKSSLFKAIVNHKSHEKHINIPKDVSIGYLSQDLPPVSENTVIEETKTVLQNYYDTQEKVEELSHKLGEIEDYLSKEYQSVLDRIDFLNHQLELVDIYKMEGDCELFLKGLGFTNEDFDRKVSSFSGGWKMRIELAKILLQNPNLLLLDEPTNHLDMDSIYWLENFLSSYRGSLLLISHDRDFLDRVTGRTLELSNKKLKDYKTNYSNFLIQKESQQDQVISAFSNQQKKIKQTEEFINKFRAKASKSNQVQSRIKQLEKMDVIEVEEEDSSSVKFSFFMDIPSGKQVLHLDNLSVGYGKKVVVKDVDAYINRGDRIALLGKNGEGKSTIINTLTGKIPQLQGKYQWGYNVKVGFFSQSAADELNKELTVFETLDHVAVGEIRTKLRSILGAFLFSKDDVDKKVKVLSGGERTRLAIAKLLIEPYNTLILDEPTNHLDITTIDMLKKALHNYKGTLIIVSHDRYFLKDLFTKVIVVGDKKMKEFHGTVENFLEKKRIEMKDKSSLQSEKNKSNSKEKDKAPQKEVETPKLKELENKISKVNQKIKKVEKIFETNPLDTIAIDEYNTLKKELDSLETEWLNLV